MSARERLETLARLHSVDLSYLDMSGELHVASDESLIRVLRHLGINASTPEDVSEALSQRELELAATVLEPVVVFWDGEAPTFVLRLPSEQLGGRYRVELRFEQQGTIHQLAGSLSTLRIIDTFTVQDGVYTDIEVRLSEKIPYGYHQLTVEIDDKTYSSQVISSPTQAFLPRESRLWGLFAPTYALKSLQGYGAGGLAELDQLVQLTQNAGGHIAATLPLMASFLDELYQPSPYVPVSRLFWNEMFLDLRKLAEVQESKEAQTILASDAFTQEAERLQKAPYVDYRAQAKLNRSVLLVLAKEAFAVGSPIRDSVEAFAQQTPRAADYARFRAVTEKLGASWFNWPERLKNGDIRPEDYDLDTYRYHLYAQWRIDQQLSELSKKARTNGGGLYLDLPLGINPEGYDAWREKNVFLDGMNVGAPPDALGPDGQDWGFRPLHPDRLRETGYRYLIECIQTLVKHAGVLRIDHVMGLHRIFCVPWGVGGKDGVYIRYRHEEIWAIVTLESHRHGAMIVGEDLGTVPAEVREAMEKHHIQRMFVLQFELNANSEKAINDIPPDAVASLNTHDTPSFAGFWGDHDIADRVELGRLEAHEAEHSRQDREHQRQSLAQFLRHQGQLPNDLNLEAITHANMRYLAQSSARMVLLNIEDLWLEPKPQNVPGTSDERPNWQRRMGPSLEEAQSMTAVEQLLTDVDEARRRQK